MYVVTCGYLVLDTLLTLLILLPRTLAVDVAPAQGEGLGLGRQIGFGFGLALGFVRLAWHFWSMIGRVSTSPTSLATYAPSYRGSSESSASLRAALITSLTEGTALPGGGWSGSGLAMRRSSAWRARARSLEGVVGVW